MRPELGIDELTRLKHQADAGRLAPGSSEFGLWQSQVAAVLSQTVGESAVPTQRFREVTFPSGNETDVRESARAFRLALRQASAALSAVIYELELGRDGVRGVETPLARDPRTVFLVRGGNAEVNRALANLLIALELRVLGDEEVITELGQGTPNTLDVVRRGMEMASATVIVLSADEIVRIGKGAPSRRQPIAEVLVAVGMALALDSTRVIIAQYGRVNSPGDLGGKSLLRISAADPTWRLDLATRLQTVGVEARTGSGRYLTAGQFP